MVANTQPHPWDTLPFLPPGFIPRAGRDVPSLRSSDPLPRRADSPRHLQEGETRHPLQRLSSAPAPGLQPPDRVLGAGVPMTQRPFRKEDAQDPWPAEVTPLSQIRREQREDATRPPSERTRERATRARETRVAS